MLDGWGGGGGEMDGMLRPREFIDDESSIRRWWRFVCVEGGRFLFVQHSSRSLFAFHYLFDSRLISMGLPVHQQFSDVMSAAPRRFQTPLSVIRF